MKIAKLYGIKMASEEPIIHSDTLYCALLDTLFQYCEKEDEKERYKGLALSSAFPFVEAQEETIYFIPFSAITAQIVGKFQRDVEKKVKRERFYSAEVVSDLNNFEKYGLGILMECETIKKFYESEIRPHVSIDRSKGTAREGALFVKKIHSFSKNAGLYFVFPEEFERDIKEALRALQNVGILGDKTVGLGYFDSFKIEDNAEKLLNHSNSGTYALMLSLYRPTEAEMEGFEQHKEELSYEIVQRAGFFETKRPSNFGYEKPVQHYFAEGSVFWFEPSKKLRVCGRHLELHGNFLAPKTIALQFEVDTHD